MDDPVFAFPKAPAPERTPGPELKSAMRRARVEVAERSAATAELRGAEVARLEMLKEALEPVFAQLPREAEGFDLGLVPGDRPRLFVDMVAYVELDRDRRTFRMVQDTRAGRFVVAESDRIDPVVDAVTVYLGRRMVERERALAGDIRVLEPLPMLARENPVREAAVAAREPVAVVAGAVATPAMAPAPTPLPVPAQPTRSYRLGDLFFMLVLGLVIGAGLVVLLAWLWQRGVLAPLLAALGWAG